MAAITSDAAALANVTVENGSPREGFFRPIWRALQKSRAHEAWRIIVTYAHLLPEGIKPAEVLSFIAAEEVYVGDVMTRRLLKT
jgi:hypothetical protein